MTDTEMLDWFENSGEKSYPVEEGGKPRHILIWIKNGRDHFRTEGASLRNCIKRADGGEGRAVG